MVSNFDAQFTEQQTDFLKEEEDKKNKNKQMKNNWDSQTPELQSWELIKNCDHDSKKQNTKNKFLTWRKNMWKETWKRTKRIVI